MLKRFFDIFFSCMFIVIFSIPMFVISLLILFTSRGPIFHVSKRIGQYGIPFSMLKFRSMRFDTPQVASHILESPSRYLTPLGIFLRKSSLDEIPQLFNILFGTMSFVGPRPALFNQFDLIDLRKKFGIDTLKPGLTGLAQICGRDELSLNQKVEYEVKYLDSVSFMLDIKILFFTFFQVFSSRNISH